ncbi:MAG: bifunctional serine/threonine-protein kinase/formylglycine-generating enzyme family protein [Gammaproteobacteria bacterium]|nr:bifunctional serine/threonine-protein kinase/formylglycine-generating enzyme family protein [Gammaproteobacteria bacterium]
MTDYLHALPAGYRIEEYELVRVLGSGGFGITYLGYDHNLDKAVALKEYLPNDLAVRGDNQSVLPKSTEDTPDYEWGLERFLNEAQTLARFDHRHIIKVHRFFRAHGTGYIVMEYAEGETLSELLQRKGTLTDAELKHILLPILDGLEAVHGADFLHRDIKPKNIVIREDGSPVLIDFGSARQSVVGKSRSVTAIVTPGYAPVEQYSSKGHQGPWTDIYALGAVCYRCLAGEPPDDATERLREDPLISASKRCKGKASTSLLGAIDRALRVDEGERPQSIKEWRQALVGDGKSATKSANSLKMRSVEDSITARTGISWSSLSLVAVIVALLGASAWQGWQLYRGAAERVPARTRGSELEAPARPAAAPTEKKYTWEELRSRAEKALMVGEMVSIPGGKFRMGDLSGVGYYFEKPVHTVTIRPFKLGKYEVTFEQWDACVADGGCNGYFPDDEGWGRGNRPVINVSWDDAQSFIDWLNRKTGGNYRLPTEAEWEYAARAGSSMKYYFGNDESQLCQHANHADRSIDFGEKNESCYDGIGERTAEVGHYQPNSYGLHDMHGNVLEWVQDCWTDSYKGAPKDGSAWTSGECSQRAIRGGSWFENAWFLRSATRGQSGRTDRFYAAGFRLAEDE